MFAFSDLSTKYNLYFWRREAKNSNAEMGYLIEKNNLIIPVEVKSQHGNSLKSLHMFLETHKKSPDGIRLSTHNYSIHNQIISYPLYAICNSAVDEDKIRFESIL